jgi:hypothetical protein
MYLNEGLAILGRDFNHFCVFFLGHDHPGIPQFLDLPSEHSGTFFSRNFTFLDGILPEGFVALLFIFEFPC